MMIRLTKHTRKSCTYFRDLVAVDITVKRKENFQETQIKVLFYDVPYNINNVISFILVFYINESQASS